MQKNNYHIPLANLLISFLFSITIIPYLTASPGYGATWHAIGYWSSVTERIPNIRQRPSTDVLILLGKPEEFTRLRLLQ